MKRSGNLAQRKTVSVTVLWLAIVASLGQDNVSAETDGAAPVTSFSEDAGSKIDEVWFRDSFVNDNLTHWLHASPQANGFFETSLDREWQPNGGGVATLVSQSRPLFMFAAGYDLTGDDAYLQAVRRGADFLVDHFRDREQGGWYWMVSDDGTVLDTKKETYGHAFVILGLSHAYRVTGESRYREAALECWAAMKRHLRDEQGGFVPSTPRDFQQSAGTKNQNPVMHLFEALLALYNVTKSADVQADVIELADFVIGQLYDRDRGCIPEFYDANWAPRTGDKGGYIDLGHQFEWAFLLSHAVELGFSEEYLNVGNRLLDFAVSVEFRTEDLPKTSDDEIPVMGSPQWWFPCEVLRSLMHYAVIRGRSDLWDRFDRALESARAHFVDDTYGGWYTLFQSEEELNTSTEKGSLWKCGYHMSGMYVEALRLTGLPALPARGADVATANSPISWLAWSDNGAKPAYLAMAGVIGTFSLGVLGLTIVGRWFTRNSTTGNSSAACV